MMNGRGKIFHTAATMREYDVLKVDRLSSFIILCYPAEGLTGD